jgi:hypothetical protein
MTSASNEKSPEKALDAKNPTVMNQMINMTLSMNQTRAEIIQRLIAKAELDFKCCGHGKCNTQIRR